MRVTIDEEGRTRVRDRYVVVAPLGVEVLQDQGLDNEIGSARIQKLGMALAGFTDYIHQDRVQIVGSSEIDFLQALEAEERTAAIRRLKKYKICCILVTKGLELPDELLRISSEEKAAFSSRSRTSSP